jgi:hypothetical protein
MDMSFSMTSFIVRNSWSNPTEEPVDLVLDELTEEQFDNLTEEQFDALL